MKTLIVQLLRSAIQLAVLLLAACGGGGAGTTAANAPQYTIGGTVTGLVSGTQVTLDDNGSTTGGNVATVATNGTFTFATPVTTNGSYAVTVGTEPAGQTCTVGNGSGSGVIANVATVSVVCSANTHTYTVGGMVTGLAGGTFLTLDDNGSTTGGNVATVTTNGAFTFATPVAAKGSYAVTVGSEPAGQTCTVGSGSGSGVTANVATVSVVCSANTYTVSGTVTGLTFGTQVTLDDNGSTTGGNVVTVTANGVFAFATPVAVHGSYAVTVGTQPAGQLCTVGSGSGMDVTANVTTVSVVCSANPYTVGGTIMGLSAGNSIILTDNGTDNLTLSANGAIQPFSFANPLVNGASYSVMLGSTAPVVQYCTSIYGAGIINAANFAGINIICGMMGGPGTFTGTGSLATARANHTATLLPDGKVLVGGGSSTAGILVSAELYDSVTGLWMGTGSLATARYAHTATLLSNGKVLVSGGVGITTHALASAELYDPVTGLWTVTGSLATARANHTATLLPDGKVLVSGGYDINAHALASAELYDPVTGLWTATGSLTTARFSHTATLLPNGLVLASGGENAGGALASAELYDSATGVWSSTGLLTLSRFGHTATLLPNGKVLVSGGDGVGAILVSAELYDPATGLWAATGSLTTARYIHTATLLPNGKVLVSGGGLFSGGFLTALASAELYDPATGLWTVTGSLAIACLSHTATLLPDGQVLVNGGDNLTTTFASAELYF